MLAQELLPAARSLLIAPRADGGLQQGRLAGIEGFAVPAFEKKKVVNAAVSRPGFLLSELDCGSRKRLTGGEDCHWNGLGTEN